MALIFCPSCGKQISDKAKVCPACGAVLVRLEEETVSQTVCQECGSEIPPQSDACPFCGCPISPDENESAKAVTQKVEVTSVNLPKMKKKTKAIIIVAIILALVAIVGVLVGIKIVNDKKAANAASAYSSNLKTISVLMISGAADAESAGNLIKSVWYNAIYEERDSSTDKYTRPDGYFVDDFNDALGNLFSDSSFVDKINGIKDNQDSVARYIKELRNPPEEFEEAYDAVKNCYDAYLTFTNLVVSPTGSLTSFSSNFNDADSALVNKYNTLKSFVD